MSMSIPYVRTGRVRQKARTQAAMIDAARELLAEGVTPTVEQAAEHAGVSRATAYRYFANQRELLAAAHPEIEAASLLPHPPPEEPLERVTLAATELMRITVDTELELRAMLRFSLDPDRPPRDLLLRKARRVTWFSDALAPLRPALGPRRFSELVLRVAAAVGIESFVWLVDMGGVSREDAARHLVRVARDLVWAAMNEAGAAGAAAPGEASRQ